jgi:hypothetical protein
MVGLGGGGCSPDRTSLHVKFPASREKNRQFLEIGPDKEIFAGIRGAKSIRCGQIPYATDQGTNLSKQGKDYPFQQRTGNAVAQKDRPCGVPQRCSLSRTKEGIAAHSCRPVRLIAI